MTSRDKRFAKNDFSRLTNADRYNFSNENFKTAPSEQGVYIIYSPRTKRVAHVGRTYRGKDGLRQRLKKPHIWIVVIYNRVP